MNNFAKLFLFMDLIITPSVKETPVVKPFSGDVAVLIFTEYILSKNTNISATA